MAVSTRGLCIVALTAALSACGGEDPAPADAGTPAGPDAAAPGPADAGTPAPDSSQAFDGGPCAPTPVHCAQDVATTLPLFGQVAPTTRLVTNTADGTGWISTVDAQAGGMRATEAFIYTRFTEQGLQRLELTDMEALDSMEWDLAFRRYHIRVNSGDSGPSCVYASQLPSNVTWPAPEALPQSVTWYVDDFFTDACGFIGDSAMGGPSLYFGGYWTFGGCVQMTGAVFLVELRSGRHVKMTVTNYYKEDGVQQGCNQDGSVPTTGSGSGNVKLKWAFVE